MDEEKGRGRAKGSLSRRTIMRRDVARAIEGDEERRSYRKLKRAEDWWYNEFVRLANVDVADRDWPKLFQVNEAFVSVAKAVIPYESPRLITQKIEGTVRHEGPVEVTLRAGGKATTLIEGKVVREEPYETERVVPFKR